jgi:hypothetical protein
MVSVNPASKSFILVFTRISCYDFFTILLHFSQSEAPSP